MQMVSIFVSPALLHPSVSIRVHPWLTWFGSGSGYARLGFRVSGANCKTPLKTRKRTKEQQKHNISLCFFVPFCGNSGVLQSALGFRVSAFFRPSDFDSTLSFATDASRAPGQGNLANPKVLC
jgi:hypothetical protein